MSHMQDSNGMNQPGNFSQCIKPWHNITPGSGHLFMVCALQAAAGLSDCCGRPCAVCLVEGQQASDRLGQHRQGPVRPPTNQLTERVFCNTQTAAVTK